MKGYFPRLNILGCYLRVYHIFLFPFPFFTFLVITFCLPLSLPCCPIFFYYLHFFFIQILYQFCTLTKSRKFSSWRNIISWQILTLKCSIFYISDFAMVVRLLLYFGQCSHYFGSFYDVFVYMWVCLFVSTESTT